MIRIDAIRELRRDLHMRPFEAERRVYLILDAHLMNEDAADALLKDLEEPPPYAVIVLVADELGSMPGDDPLALPARSVPPAVGDGGPRRSSTARARPPGRGAAIALARVAAGRLDRVDAPPRPAARRRGGRCCSSTRAAIYRRADVRPRRGRRGASSRCTRERGAEARSARRRSRAGLELTAREAEQRIRRAQRGRRARGAARTRWRSSRRGTATSSSSRRGRGGAGARDRARPSCARTPRASGSRAPSSRRRRRARDVAQARGVQPRAAACARGPLRRDRVRTGGVEVARRSAVNAPPVPPPARADAPSPTREERVRLKASAGELPGRDGA